MKMLLLPLWVGWMLAITTLIQSVMCYKDKPDQITFLTNEEIKCELENVTVELRRACRADIMERVSFYVAIQQFHISGNRDQREANKETREDQQVQYTNRALSFTSFSVDPRDIKSVLCFIFSISVLFALSIHQCCKSTEPTLPTCVVLIYMTVVVASGTVFVMYDIPRNWIALPVSLTLAGLIGWFVIPMHFAPMHFEKCRELTTHDAPLSQNSSKQPKREGEPSNCLNY